MSGQRLLIDNDAFIIFTGTDLLSDTLALLGYEPVRALRLHALPFMLGRQKSLRKTFPPDVLTKARLACDQIPALEEREANPEILGRLIDASDDINAGEALLLAVAIERPEYSLLTGDRRALIAFGQAAGLTDLREKLAGRIVCTEILLRVLVSSLGIGEVSTRIAPLIPIHRSIGVFFSPGNLADQTQCLEALDSYFTDLCANVGAALLLDPFSD